jgi:hypothetical protein
MFAENLEHVETFMYDPSKEDFASGEFWIQFNFMSINFPRCFFIRHMGV